MPQTRRLFISASGSLPFAIFSRSVSRKVNGNGGECQLDGLPRRSAGQGENAKHVSSAGHSRGRNREASRMMHERGSRHQRTCGVWCACVREVRCVSLRRRRENMANPKVGGYFWSWGRIPVVCFPQQRYSQQAVAVGTQLGRIFHSSAAVVLPTRHTMPTL